jgi:LysR family transcriptional regulator for metE and metH
VDAEIRHLQLVAAIADTGSVTRAADALHLTQSALSHQLRGLESRLGTPLFHRAGKKMVPTVAGHELIASARRVLDIVSRTEEGIKRVASGREAHLRLCTECYTCYHWLPSVLTAFRETYPHVEVHIDAAATPDPVKALLNGEIDVAVISSDVRDRRLDVHPLFVDEMRVIMTPKHRLARRDYIRAEDFVSETMLLYPPIEDSSVYQRVLVSAGVKPASVQQVPLTEAIIELVMAGFGIAVLASWAVEPHVRNGSLAAVPLTRRGYERQWTAVTLAGAASARYLKDFIALVATNTMVARPTARTARRGLRPARISIRP